MFLDAEVLQRLFHCLQQNDASALFQVHGIVKRICIARNHTNVWEQGYFLASFLFMAMMFSLPICLGLAALALDLPVGTHADNLLKFCFISLPSCCSCWICSFYVTT